MKEVNRKEKQTLCECDNCGYQVIIEDTSYSAINIELRENGWWLRNIDGEWLDFCSYDCFREYKEDNE